MNNDSFRLTQYEDCKSVQGNIRLLTQTARPHLSCKPKDPSLSPVLGSVTSLGKLDYTYLPEQAQMPQAPAATREATRPPATPKPAPTAVPAPESRVKPGSGVVYGYQSLACVFPTEQGTVSVERNLQKTPWGFVSDVMTTADEQEQMCTFAPNIGGIPTKAILTTRVESGVIIKAKLAASGTCYRDANTEVCYDNVTRGYTTTKK